jgi:glycosidase
VDALRMDAIPYLVERDGTSCENLPETHKSSIKRIRAAIDAELCESVMLAEANQWPTDVRPYFGDGDECHMAFHFPLMPRIYMALRQEDRLPITDIMAQTPDHSRQLPVGALPPQPRRTHAGDGHQRRARLYVLLLLRRPAHARQRGHSPPAGARWWITTAAASSC